MNPSVQETILSRPHLSRDGLVAFFDQNDVEHFLLFEIAMQAMEGNATLETYQRLGRSLPLTRFVEFEALGDPMKRPGAQTALDWLLAHGESLEGGLVWRHQFDLHHPAAGILRAPWPSAFSQAYILLALLHWNRFHPTRVTAQLVRQACRPFLQDNGGFITREANGGVWFQEYPFEQPTYVFNAHLISIVALARALRIAANSEIPQRIEAAVQALLEKWDSFNRGIWTRYDLQSQGWIMFRARAADPLDEVRIESVTLRRCDGHKLGSWSAASFEESIDYGGPFQGADWHLAKGITPPQMNVSPTISADQYLVFRGFSCDFTEILDGLRLEIRVRGAGKLLLNARDPRDEALKFRTDTQVADIGEADEGVWAYSLSWDLIGPPLPMHYQFFHFWACNEASRLLQDDRLGTIAQRLVEQILVSVWSKDSEISDLQNARRELVSYLRVAMTKTTRTRHEFQGRETLMSPHPSPASKIELARAIAEMRYRELSRRHQIMDRHWSAMQTRSDELGGRLTELLARTHDLNTSVTTLQNQLAMRMGVSGGIKEVLRSTKSALVGSPLGTPRQEFPLPWKSLPRPTSPPGAQMRVLVLSHMFPHPEQPSSGPFIHEQVKALRQNTGVDARVVVCRPFWMRNRNPFKVLRSNRCYRRYLNHCLRWWDFDSVPVAYLPYRIFGPWFTQGWSYRSSVMDAMPWIRSSFPFDLVHAHTGYLDGSAGLAVAKSFRVPLVITEHTGPFTLLMRNPVVKQWTLRSMNGAASVIVVSEAQRRAVNEHLASKRPDHLVVLPNVVDIDLFHPPKKWRPNPMAPRIVFVGYFVPIKQLPMLLRAFEIVRSKIRGATLRLVGGGENVQQENDLKAEIQRLRLDRYIQVDGHQSRADVANIMREECDVLVLCSQSETFGCVLIEALASGKPVVATRCGGPEDIVTQNDLGRLCPNGSAEELSAAILDVVTNIDKFDPARIRRHAEDHFSFGAVSRRISGLYEHVLAARAGSNLQPAAITG